MGKEDQPREKKEYEVSVVGENTSFKVKRPRQLFYFNEKERL